MTGWERQLRELAQEHGAVLEMTRAGHFKIRHPTAGWVAFASGTPGDRRTFINTRAVVRRLVRQHRDITKDP